MYRYRQGWINSARIRRYAYEHVRVRACVCVHVCVRVRAFVYRYLHRPRYNYASIVSVAHPCTVSCWHSSVRLSPSRAPAVWYSGVGYTRTPRTSALTPTHKAVAVNILSMLMINI